MPTSELTSVGPPAPERVRAAELRAVQEVATEILSRLDVEATLLSVTNAAVELLGADIAGIMLVDKHGEALEMRACTGHRTVDTARLRVQPGQGVAGKVFETRAPVKVDDYLTDSSISQDFAQIAKEEGKRSALGAPMATPEEFIGVLMVWRRRPSVFGSEDTRRLTSLASLGTIAIVNARLHERQRSTVTRLEAANAQLEAQYELLARSAEVHEQLTDLVLEGKGLTHLVHTLVNHTGGQAVILDANLGVLATSPDAGEGDPEAMAARAGRHLRGTHTPSRRACVVAPSDRFSKWLLLREVVARGECLGYLLVGLAEEPDSQGARVVEQAAIVCALELTKELAVLESRTRVHTELVWDLLEGNIGDEAEALVRARYLGYTLPSALRVVLLPISGVEEWARSTGSGPDAVDHRRQALVRTAARVAENAVGCRVSAARRGSLIALLAPATDDPAEATELATSIVEHLREHTPGMTCSAGVSECVPFTADLRQAYSQAQHALSAVPIMAADPPVAVFDDLGVVRFLLAPGDRSELLDYAHVVLGPVLAYDREHATGLLATIEAYLAEDCNLQRTAKRLYLHPKTVRYRLDRVEEFTSLDLSSQQGRFDAQLGATILRALQLDGGDP